MKFSLNITLKEEDYLAFNFFHNLESKQTQKINKRARNIFIIAMVAMMVITLVTSGWDAVSSTYIIFLLLITIAFTLLFKHFIKYTVKLQVKTLKKTGKLPYDAESTLEFYEDKIVEITSSKRIEQNYDVLERICLLPGRYIFLYTSSVGAYILPVYQVNAQIGKDEFWDFISEKCKTIETY